MKHTIATKYVKPNKEDKADMNTIARVILDEGESFYVQVSPDSEQPEWVEAKDFLGEVFGDLMVEKEFVEECTRIYQNKKNNPLFNIVKIISNLCK